MARVDRSRSRCRRCRRQPALARAGRLRGCSPHGIGVDRADAASARRSTRTAGHGRGAVAAGARGHPDHRCPGGRHARTGRDPRPRERSFDGHLCPHGGGRGDRRRGRRTDGAAGGAAIGDLAARRAGCGDRRDGRLPVPRPETVRRRRGPGPRTVDAWRHVGVTPEVDRAARRPRRGRGMAGLDSGCHRHRAAGPHRRRLTPGARRSHGHRRVAAPRPSVPVHRELDGVSARSAGVDPGPGLGVDDDDWSHARRHRVRRPCADHVATQGDTDAAARRRVVGHRCRRPPAQQCVVVRAVRRRRAHGGRRRPARHAGSPSRPLAQRVGRGRSGRPRAGRCRPRRAGRRPPAHRG